MGRLTDNGTTTTKKNLARKHARKTRDVATKAPVAIGVEARKLMIEEAAYYIAERSAFAQGRELDHWLEAERQIDSVLEAGTPAIS